MKSLQTRTELLLISSGWFWTFALAALNTPQGGVRMAVVAGVALTLSLVFRRTVWNFFRADLGTLGDGITTAYLWAIVGCVAGFTLAAYALFVSIHRVL